MVYTREFAKYWSTQVTEFNIGKIRSLYNYLITMSGKKPENEDQWIIAYLASALERLSDHIDNLEYENKKRKYERKPWTGYHVEKIDDFRLDFIKNRYYILDGFDSPVWFLGIHETEQEALAWLMAYIKGIEKDGRDS